MQSSLDWKRTWVATFTAFPVYRHTSERAPGYACWSRCVGVRGRMRRCVFIQDVTGGWRHGQGSNPPPVGKRVPLHRARPFRNLGDLALAMRAGAGQVQYTKHCSCHCCTRFVAPRIQTPWIWYLDFFLLLLDIWIFLLHGEGRRGRFASRVDEWNCKIKMSESADVAAHLRSLLFPLWSEYRGRRRGDCSKIIWLRGCIFRGRI